MRRHHVLILLVVGVVLVLGVLLIVGVVNAGDEASGDHRPAWDRASARLG